MQKHDIIHKTEGYNVLYFHHRRTDSQKISLSLDMWFLRYADRQRHRDMLI